MNEGDLSHWQELISEALQMAASPTSGGQDHLEAELLKKHPNLSRDEIHAAAVKCFEVRTFVSKAIEIMFSKTAGIPDVRVFKQELGRLFTWVDEPGLTAMFSMGMYIAYKDGYLG